MARSRTPERVESEFSVIVLEYVAPGHMPLQYGSAVNPFWGRLPCRECELWLVGGYLLLSGLVLLDVGSLLGQTHKLGVANQGNTLPMCMQGAPLVRSPIVL